MKFVEDHQTDAFQRRILLQATGKNALGDHLDARVRPDLAVQANAVADRLANPFTQFAGQALGGSTSGQPAWFEHEDILPGQPRRIQQCQRYAGGLAGAGRRLQHGFVTGGQGIAQGGQQRIDRQGIHHFSTAGRRL